MEDVSVVSLLGRLVVSLAVVLALMAGLAHLLRTRGVGGVRGASRAVAIEVVARQQLTRAASVAVVRTAGRVLVLGVSDHAVQVLTEVDPETLPVEEERTPLGAPSGGQSWKAFVDALRERTVRR
ncbi:MAG: flagellar biosynthetic protein FliO [Actinomycetota bacterium]|nr:flagellar biosynthetic protein FliO [Actinomycetota bacterium]